MRWTPCSEDALVAYVNGKMSEATAAEVEAHSRFCDHCNTAIHRLRGFALHLRVSGRLAREREYARDHVPTLLALPPDEWYVHLQEEPRLVSIDAAWLILAEADRLSEDEPRRAIAHYKLAVHVAEEIRRTHAVPSFELLTAAWRDLAWSLRRVGEYSEATEALAHAEAAAALCADRELMLARIELARGILLTSMQQLDEALAAVRRARETFAKLKDDDRYAATVDQEANILLVRKDGFAALALLKNLIARPMDDSTRARLFANIAHAFELAGNLTAARTYLEQACELHKALGYAYWVHKETWTLGRILVKEGQIDAALETLARASAGFRDLDDPDGTILVDLYRSEVEIEHGTSSPETYVRLRKAAAYAVEKDLPEAQCKALTFLRRLGRAVTAGHVRYVTDFIRDLQRHPSRRFIPPELAA